MEVLSKAQVRREVFRIRRELSQEEISEKSACVTKQLIAYLGGVPAHEPMEEIYVYASYGGEVDTGSFINFCLERNIRVAVPRVCEDGENMEFYYIHSLQDLESGYKGIPEPKYFCRKAENSRKKQIMILPGVGFDLQRNRVGYGKGFYDRYLERYPDFMKIGICFEEQIFEQMECAENDISMDVIVTNQRMIGSGL